MPIDSSIYQNIRPTQIDMPSPLDSASKMMSLSQLAMQSQAMQRQLQIQTAMREAYAKHTGADGTLDQAGFLADAGRIDPETAMQSRERFAKVGKDVAEARGAQADSITKMQTITGPRFDYLAALPESQRAGQWGHVIQSLKDDGIDVSKMDHPYDPVAFNQYYKNWRNTKASLENQKTQSEIAMAPIKAQNDMYGTRGANAELTSQYDKQAGPIRSSQMAMNQMLDNYNHPSPQGDASLILNAFKIKFPTAPDVNSLKELSESQAASDQFKQYATKALSGGVDQPTRDNLLRDAVSTYRGNVDSLRGIQERYRSRQQFQGVNDPTLTAEPAIDKTYQAAMELQGKIGPYVPPAERGGIMAGVNKLAAKVVGVGQKPANAAPMPKPGAEDSGFVFMGGNPADPKAWKKAR